MRRTNKDEVDAKLNILLHEIYKATLSKKMPRRVRTSWDAYQMAQLKYELQKDRK